MSVGPVVSVIIPCYNQARYLDQAIESALQQTYPHVEVIVVDDGSVDDTPEVAGRYAGRIRYIRKENQGLSIARNTGILQSRGEYVAFLDSDDLWRPEKLQKQVEMMESNHDIDLCHTGFQIIRADGSILERVEGREIGSYVQLLGGNDVGVLTVLLRRRALAISGLFDPRYRSVQDYDMWLKLIRHIKFGFIPSSEALYRQHDSSMTSNPAVMYSETRAILQSHLEHALLHGDRTAAAAARANSLKEDQRFTAVVLGWCSEARKSGSWKRFLMAFRDGLVAHRSRGRHLRWVACHYLARAAQKGASTHPA